MCCDVVSYEALSMKMLSEVDGVYCLVVRPSSFLSIKTKDHSSLLVRVCGAIAMVGVVPTGTE